MTYSIPCACGRSVAVTASDAGTTRPCACALNVTVPSLRGLRLAAGQAATDTPEVLVRALSEAGALPEGKECVGCGVPTEESVGVHADCERRELRGGGVSGDGASILLVRLLFGWLLGSLFARAMFRDREEVREMGHDVQFDLPLRICRDCARGLRGGRLKQMTIRVPLYGRLLEKYPRARLAVKPASGGVGRDR